jgi:hypothetical protein
MTTIVMKKQLLITLLVLSVIANAQYSGHNSIIIESLNSTGSDLPFWMNHNQSGIVPLNAKSCQLASISSHHRVDSLFDSSLGLKGGFNLIGSYSGKYHFHFNELYVGTSFLNFKLEAGWFREEMNFNGFSSTNGNIDRSLNARPLPKIRFGTDGFIPFFFWKDWFSYKAEYDEGWLGKEQYVKNAHLHHKSLYGKFKLKKDLNLTAGLNHYVFWGGISPDYGALPSDLSSYFLYITGRTGSSAFPETDQLNVAGNQLGSYYLQLELIKTNFDISLYLNHPFEDHSGMELDNWRDNLIGLFIDFKRKGFIEQALFEYMYTVHQSGDTHLYGYMRGRDNYYNHGVYRSGFTYEGYSMASPLFSPLRFEDDIVTAIENNRIVMHHLALKGCVFKYMNWMGMFTYTHNLGAYSINEYKNPKDQFSSILTFDYKHPKFPIDLSLSVAADLGQLYEKRVGTMLKLSKSW